MLGANFIERYKHGGVDGARDLENGAGDALHAHDAAFIKLSCGCGVGRLLYLGLIRRCNPFVGRVLRAHWCGVLEALQSFDDGIGHVDVDVVFQVVPIDGKSTVLAAR